MFAAKLTYKDYEKIEHKESVMRNKLARNLLIGTLTLSTTFNAVADEHFGTLTDFIKVNPLLVTEATKEENEVILDNLFISDESENIVQPTNVVIKDANNNILTPENYDKAANVQYIFNADEFEENKKYMFNGPYSHIPTILIIRGELKNTLLNITNAAAYIEKLTGNAHIYINNDSIDDGIEQPDAMYSFRGIAVGYMGPHAAITATKGTRIRVIDDSSEPNEDGDNSYVTHHPGKEYTLYSY